MKKIVKAINKTGLKHTLTTIKMRKSKDLKNFLKRKKKQEKRSLKKRFYYRYNNPKWCVFTSFGLCHYWAYKLDEKCKDCDFNEKNRK